MPDTISISLNEFRALLRKAFEGIYGHSRDWNALADTILWQEYHGLAGLSCLYEVATRLQTAKRPELTEISRHETLVTGDGNSLLTISLELCDLAISTARRNGRAVMHIRNVIHPELIAASVARCAQSGQAAAAWWPGAQGSAFIAFQDVAEAAPNLFEIALPEGYQDYADITLIASKSLKNIEQDYPDWFGFKADNQHVSNVISDRYKAHLENGYQITAVDYDRLCKLADMVLVEATERSRRGAGD